jgi:biotin synthase-related radical SAM superfamily protein
LSSNAHAEGVSLAGYTLVIAGTDFSGARHAQRRERCINIMLQGDVTVHMIVTNGGISREVYKTVTDKKDFNLALYRRWRAENA